MSSKPAKDDRTGSWKLSIQEAAAAMDGRLEFIGDDGLHDLSFSGVGTDSRNSLDGQVFFALVGDTHDAHDHLVQAVQRGATGLVIHRDLEEKEKAELRNLSMGKGFPIGIIRVADTLMALQELSHFWRSKSNALFLGITGTNGKTTTKEFAAAIIGSKFRVQYSKGSFNNHWGVPISLLSVAPEHEVAVIEMGMNHLGELQNLSRLVEADTVVCTMVGRGHLEGVGSLQGVAEAKAEIYKYAPERASFIFNLDNSFTHQMYEDFALGEGQKGHRRLTFSDSSLPLVLQSTLRPALASGVTPDVSLRVVSMTPDQLLIAGDIRGVSGEASVSVFGAQNITNLMAASCLALSVGVSPEEVWKALPNCRSGWGRNQWVQLASGARALFDGYNANPESMRAALTNVRLLKDYFTGRRIAVLGEMRELGSEAPELHRELGELVAQTELDRVIFFGPSFESFKKGFLNLSSTVGTKDLKQGVLTATAEYQKDEALKLGKEIKKDDFVLLKGSRGMSVEKFLKELSPTDF